eukprot:29456-Pelagococcus_subviridis.AAC.7
MNVRPRRHSAISTTPSYPTSRIAAAIGTPDKKTCRGAWSLSARSNGAYSSSVAPPRLPPPGPPPTATCRPNGRLLTIAATRASSRPVVALTVAAQSVGAVASFSRTTGGGESKPVVASSVRFPPLPSFAAGASASSSIARSDACSAGMCGRNDAMFPRALLALSAMSSPPTARCPRAHAACKMVPPPQHGSMTTSASPPPPPPPRVIIATFTAAAAISCLALRERPRRRERRETEDVPATRLRENESQGPPRRVRRLRGRRIVEPRVHPVLEPAAPGFHRLVQRVG